MKNSSHYSAPENTSMRRGVYVSSSGVSLPTDYALYKDNGGRSNCCVFCTKSIGQYPALVPTRATKNGKFNIYTGTRCCVACAKATLDMVVGKDDNVLFSTDNVELSQAENRRYQLYRFGRFSDAVCLYYDHMKNYPQANPDRCYCCDKHISKDPNKHRLLIVPVVYSSEERMGGMVKICSQCEEHAQENDLGVIPMMGIHVSCGKCNQEYSIASDEAAYRRNNKGSYLCPRCAEEQAVVIGSVFGGWQGEGSYVPRMLERTCLCCNNIDRFDTTRLLSESEIRFFNKTGVPYACDVCLIDNRVPNVFPLAPDKFLLYVRNTGSLSIKVLAVTQRKILTAETLLLNGNIPDIIRSLRNKYKEPTNTLF